MSDYLNFTEIFSHKGKLQLVEFNYKFKISIKKFRSKIYNT